jgi:transketolase
MSRPDPKTLIGQNTKDVPMSCQRILKSSDKAESVWIGPDDAAKLSKEEAEAYESAQTIISHMAIEMPRAHKSGHPGGPLSAFTPAYWVMKLRDPSKDQPLRMSPGHLSILGFTLQYLFGRGGDDARLSSPAKLIETFRTPSGLPGHIEAGIGDIPFGTGPLGKGVSNALGVAFGLKHQKKSGIVDVLLADGDAQEGQVPEAFRLAAHLKVDNLIVHGDWNDVQLSGLPTEVVSADFAQMATAMGWQVIEAQNGNDPAQVKSAIEKANGFIGKGRPIFICYYTTMGNGIALMEEGSNTGKKNYHGAPLSDAEAANALKTIPKLEDAVKAYAPHLKNEKKRYESKPAVITDIKLTFGPKEYKRTVTKDKGAARKDFGETHIMNLMKADDRIIVLHADLAGSGGFTKVEKEFPDRVINVGVAEANMAMMAAGLRQTGMLPITYTFAAFGTNEARANARLIDVNCGHTRCGVIHDCTHSGLSVGEDGETHQERNYLNIPFDNTEIWMPGDSNQAGAMAERAMELICEGHKSVYVFSARSGHEQLLDDKGKPVYDEKYVFDGKATLVAGVGNSSDQATIITTGITLHEAIKASEILKSEKVQVRILNVACIRPLDSSAIIQAALETEHLIVVEDHNSEGGLATQVADVIADFQLPCSLRRLGANHYFPSAPAKDLFLMAGIDAESIADAVQDEIRTEVCGGEDVLTSCIHSLPHNLTHSRFEESAKPYIERLKNEDGYLEALREEWRERACPNEKIPSDDELKESL